MHEGLPGCGERNGEPSARPRLAQWADRPACNPHSRMCRPVNTFCGFGVASGGQDFACGCNASRVARERRRFKMTEACKLAVERRRSESNRRIEVLQTSALPLGYGAN